MAAELKTQLSITAELIPGKGGIFDIAVDGRVVAAKSRGAIDGLSAWLEERAGAGRSIVGYGAAAKGNTFLNAVGEPARRISWVVDASPEKQGKFLPGTHVPVVAPDAIAREMPDDVLILPWNLQAEISELVDERSPRSESWVAIPEMRRV